MVIMQMQMHIGVGVDVDVDGEVGADVGGDDDGDEDDDDDDDDDDDAGSSPLGKKSQELSATEVVTKLSLLFTKPHAVSYVFLGFLRAHLDQVPRHSLSTS